MTSEIRTAARLAINGGPAVRPVTRSWPTWPVTDANAEHALSQTLHSRRWAISSPYLGELAERRFARRFADYVGTRHCVPTDHGSSALLIALESLRLEAGDYVLVPALTWTASATAVFRAGLVPILVDVDPLTGCVNAGTLDLDVSPRAVIVVHWACSMADMSAVTKLAAERDIAVIEDAAQAHGAQWLGRGAGSLGRLGCFSMQHSKVLTCGEGGAVVTDDDSIAGVLEELRADSRRYREQRTVGELELAETASTMGANFCLNEFGAALACVQLDLLDEQHAIRNRNFLRLCELLRDVPGVRLLGQYPEQSRLSLYEVPIIFDPLPAGVDNGWVASALTAELGVRVYTPRTPLNCSNLLQPWTKPSLAPLAQRFVAQHRSRDYPGAEYLVRHSVVLHHSAFLGPEQDMVDLAEAVAKIVT